MSKLIAQFKIPGQEGSEKVVVPSGLPEQVTGGFDDTGVGVFQLGMQYVFYLAVVLAVIFILTSGIQMITSGGDTQKLASGRKRLIFAIIGLVVVLGSFFIVGVILQVLGSDLKLF